MYGHSGDELKISIEWKTGCVTDVEEQRPRDLLGDKGEIICVIRCWRLIGVTV